MNYLPNTRRNFRRPGEQGAARLNFLVTLFVIAVLGYVASQYIPIAYHAYLLKDSMQQAVDMGAVTGKNTEWIRTRLRSEADGHGVPSEASINVQKLNGRVEAQVRWTRTIPLPGYIYQYDFDHTVRSGTYLSE